MDVQQLKSNIEFLSEQVHNAWWEEKKRQGFRSPRECKHTMTDKFTKACDKCHTDMYPYEELPEHIKEYDRVMVRTVIEAIDKLG